MADVLFQHLEKLQGSTSWGSFLDAGSGSHSLEWITSLDTSSWTAVTGDPALEQKLLKRFGTKQRPGDRIVCGNWKDPAFLHGEQYAVVLADYLLGAIDGFAPYFQDQLFPRLRPLVGSKLYYVGLGPYDDTTEDPWGKLIVEIARLRDACILLAGHRTYREFPLDWVLRHLETAGFEVEDVQTYPIRYGAKFVDEQLDVCVRKLPHFHDQKLAQQMRKTIEELRGRAHGVRKTLGARPFGEDYVISARPR